MIPDFTDDGYLPPGIHPATLEEFAERFAIFDQSDRRLRLFDDIHRLVVELRDVALVVQVFIAGSYVTAKPQPNDFDCLIVFDPELTSTPMRPSDYNVVSQRMVRKRFRGDIMTAILGSPRHADLLTFFQRTRLNRPKGIVEILL